MKSKYKIVEVKYDNWTKWYRIYKKFLWLWIRHTVYIYDGAYFYYEVATLEQAEKDLKELTHISDYWVETNTYYY